MADQIWYVDPDATGGDDGSSWADAYQDFAGFQTALDDGTDEDFNTTIYVRLSTSSTFDMGASDQLDLGIGGTPSTTNPTANNWLKIIACHAGGTEVDPKPITVADRGTYVTIKATGDPTVMVKYSEAIDRVAWYGFKFDGNNSTATNGFKVTSSDAARSEFHLFVNCCFDDADDNSCYFDSNRRGMKFIDCDFLATSQVSKSNPEALYNATFIRCNFKSNYYQSVRYVGALGCLFLYCVFDPQGAQYCIRNNSSYANHFINCAFVNFTTAAVWADSQNNFDVFVNCYFEGNDASNDHVYDLLGTDDSLSVIAMHCASNLQNGEFDESGFVLDPYMTAADVLFDNEATNVRVSGSHQLASSRRYEGLPDQYGNPSMIGPESMNAMTEAKRRRHHV